MYTRVSVVYVCVCLSVCVYLCLCVCKPEVNAGCLLQSLPSLFFETSSLAEPGAHRLVCIGWSAAPGIFLSASGSGI